MPTRYRKWGLCPPIRGGAPQAYEPMEIQAFLGRSPAEYFLRIYTAFG